MRKKVLFVFLLLILLHFDLNSKEDYRYWIFFNSGISFPIYPDAFKEGYRTAFDMGGGFGLNLSPGVSLVGNFNYSKFISKEKYTMYWKGIYDEKGYYKASIFSFLCDLRFNLIRKRKLMYPYFFGNTGIIVLNREGGSLYIEGAGMQVEGTTIHFCLGGGFGLNFKISKRSNLFIETRYTIIFLNEEKGNSVGYLPIRLGISFNL